MFFSLPLYLGLCPYVGHGTGDLDPHPPTQGPVGSIIFIFLPVENLNMLPWATSYLHAPLVWGMAPLVQKVNSFKNIQMSWILEDLLVLKWGGGWRRNYLGPYLLCDALSSSTFCLASQRRILLSCSLSTRKLLLAHSFSWSVLSSWPRGMRLPGPSVAFQLLRPKVGLYAPSHQGNGSTYFSK